MSSAPLNPPRELIAFQEAFGNSIRTPLTPRADEGFDEHPEDYEARVVEQIRDTKERKAAQRLMVYNQQYWYRLIDALADAFPLLWAQIGKEQALEYAIRFLKGSPSQHYSLSDLGRDFPDFILETCGNGPEYEAAVLDDWYDYVWTMADSEVIDLAAQPPETLAQIPLQFRETVCLFASRYNSQERRSQLLRDDENELIALQETSSYHLLFRDRLPKRLSLEYWQWCIALQFREPQSLEAAIEAACTQLSTEGREEDLAALGAGLQTFFQELASYPLFVDLELSANTNPPCAFYRGAQLA